MRSSRNLLAALVLVACGTDSATSPDDDDDPVVEPTVCDTSYLDYDNFGAPFVVSWCRGCHSSQVPMNMRQKAPPDVNFDDADDVAHWKERIRARAAVPSGTMPPAGSPSAEERALLLEWIDCGAK